MIPKLSQSQSTDEYYLELSNNPIRFEAVSQLTNVFFDDANRQVFAVRSGGVTGVVVKGPEEDASVSFRMEDKGPVISIKFSSDQRILAVQRTNTTVEFMNFTNSVLDPLEYSLSCKGKSIIVGFIWISHNEIAVITDLGIELHTVLADKHTLKLTKTLPASVQWFTWCPKRGLALLASSPGLFLQPVQFKAGSLSKLSRLEMEPGRSVMERDVTLAELYGSVYVLILRHNPERSAEVQVYSLESPTPRKKHVLRLGLSGRFAVNVVDDLIVVHHQASKTSMLFDIGLHGDSTSNGVTFHPPLAPARPIKPCILKHNSLESPTINCDLYSATWVVFQPDVVIDARLGCFWCISLQLSALCKLVIDRVILCEILLNRTNGKPALVKVLKELVNQKDASSLLPTISEVFTTLNRVYKGWLDSELQSQTATVASVKPVQVHHAMPRVMLAQYDMYSHVLQGMQDAPHVGWVLICYLKSLTEHSIPAGHALTEMLITTLMRKEKFSTLQQLLQYGVLADSKPLACMLVSLSRMYPAARQIAQDMLARLNAHEEILEVLFSEGEVLEALRLARSVQGPDSISARKFLQSAQNTGDPLIFHAVYDFFIQRNMRITGSPTFPKSDHCDSFVTHYHTLFPK